jgi:hypothetical protein
MMIKELVKILFYGFCGLFAAGPELVSGVLVVVCALLGFCGIWFDMPEWATAFFLGAIVCYLFEKQFSKSTELFAKKLEE